MVNFFVIVYLSVSGTVEFFSSTGVLYIPTV